MPAHRKPTAHLRLAGTQAAPSGPVPGLQSAGEPEPPEHLEPAAQVVWRSTVTHMAAVPHWLSIVDLPLLETYCAAVATHRAAMADVAARGHLVPGRSTADRAADALVRNPSVLVAAQAAATVRQTSQALGLSPWARERMVLGEPTDGKVNAEGRPVSRLLS